MPIRSLGLLILVAMQFQGEELFLGHVIRAKGDWKDNDFLVKKGYAVSKNSQLKISGQPDPDNLLEVRSYADNEPYTFSCSKVICSDPLNISVLLPKGSAPGTLAAFFNGLIGVIADMGKSENAPSLARYATTLSKGGESPKNAVTALQNGSVNLQDAFEGMPAGAYLLELCPVASEGTVSCPASLKPTAWTFQAAAPQPYSQPDLHPGLYELRLFTRTEAGLSRMGSAPALLLTAANKLGAKKALLQNAVAATSAWSAAESSMALRAYMQSLAATE